MEARTKKLLFYVLAVLMGGCVPIFSLHPLYTDRDLVFKKKLLGTWADVNNPEVTWEFKRAEEPGKAYRLVFCDDNGKKGSFDVHLVNLKGRFFLDVYPAGPPWDPEDPNKIEWYYNAAFLVPVHTFIKVESIEPMLRMRLSDHEGTKALLEAEPNAVDHAVIEETVILTAPTKQLQAFILKHADNEADDERIFQDHPVVLQRTAKAKQKPRQDKKSGDSAGK